MTDEQVNTLASYRGSVVQLMNEKFEIGRERYGDSWLDADPEYLLDRMEEEFYEFRQSVEHDEDSDAALEEMADIVNFGLMYLVRSTHDTSSNGMSRSTAKVIVNTTYASGGVDQSPWNEEIVERAREVIGSDRT